MLSTVSPVMVGADAASPQPTVPLSASMRTSRLSARDTSSPAITTGFFIGRLIATGSTRLIFTKDAPFKPPDRGVVAQLPGHPDRVRRAPHRCAGREEAAPAARSRASAKT